MSNKKDVSIEATLRTGIGKSYTRKLRRDGKVPAVLNSKGKSTLLELDPKLLSRAWRDCGRQFDLVLEGKTQRVQITELQVHPVRRLALHVDLAPVV